MVYFHYNHDNPQDLFYEQQYPFQYIASEINTLSDIIEKKKIIDEDGDVDIEFYSIILEVLEQTRLLKLK